MNSGYGVGQKWTDATKHNNYMINTGDKLSKGW